MLLDRVRTSNLTPAAPRVLDISRLGYHSIGSHQPLGAMYFCCAFEAFATSKAGWLKKASSVFTIF